MEALKNDNRKSCGKRCVNPELKQETSVWGGSCPTGLIESVACIIEKERLFGGGSCCVGTSAKDALHMERVRGRGATLQKARLKGG